MDYRDLLKKYMKHVGECEGIDYVGEYDRHATNIFSDEEWAELRNISDEVYIEIREKSELLG